MRKFFVNCFIILALTFTAAWQHTLFAQGVTTSSMSGIVTDVQGNPLIGANVVAVHNPSGTRYGASTRDNGQFNIPNMRIGGQAIATDITKRERELCDILGEKLKADGILLAGLDTIAGQLIEINVTSPTGLRTLDKLTGADAGEMFWIGVEKSIG